MNITRSLTIGPKAQARKFPLFLSPDSSPQCLIRVVTLLFFHAGAIYHVHRKHGALTRNLSTNTATADNLKHTSDPKTLSFTRNDPLRTSVPSRGWGARSRHFRRLSELASISPSFRPTQLLKVVQSIHLRPILS